MRPHTSADDDGVISKQAGKADIPEGQATKLRFGVGDKVLARVTPTTWAEATIMATNFHAPEMPPGLHVPYVALLRSSYTCTCMCLVRRAMISTLRTLIWCCLARCFFFFAFLHGFLSISSFALVCPYILNPPSNCKFWFLSLFYSSHHLKSISSSTNPSPLYHASCSILKVPNKSEWHGRSSYCSSRRSRDCSCGWLRGPPQERCVRAIAFQPNRHGADSHGRVPA